MSTRQIAEYGFWKSPITSDLIVAETISLGAVGLGGDDVYWLEGRPGEGGRYVLVRRTADGATTDVNPAPFNVRTRVHEYGGGSCLVDDRTVYFSNFEDQRLYRCDDRQPPRPITEEGPWRYADSTVDRQRNRLISVREDHSRAGQEATGAIVEIDLAGRREPTVLVAGNDFYSNPRLSPDGSQLAWLEWSHPNMPWDGTELWTAEVQPDGSLAARTQVAGGASESIFQPEWSPAGTLYFVSDRSGWWNLYRISGGAVEPLAEMQAEFAAPQWIFGQSTYAFTSEESLICAYNQSGIWQLASLDAASKQLTDIETPFTHISDLQASDGSVLFCGGSTDEPPAIVLFNLADGSHDVLRRSFTVSEPIRRYLSQPEAVEFPTENKLTAHAFFYSPYNPDYAPPSDEKPPLIVISHGGPTGATSNTLSLSVQYWTSRGFGVLDVNYGGSTGYGRAYRLRLNGQWGVVDVADCANAAEYLVGEGRADGERLIIRGGSAGGYTTLAALAFCDVFRAGASYYGVSDLEALAKETHKFESRYLDNLVGPYPERRDLYVQRSPVHAAERLTAPVIFFQGSEDKVVLPNQAEMMVDALRSKSLPVAYLLFDGEQHGFRRAENIKRCLDAELYFYAAILLRKGVRF